ncbi:acyltransferase [Solirubrobacter sp. CPCC 204708]|uniref:Acyltransferase n=1 Tax=Solirubrobacter deserti TaxID=2282478 RepID=A0ABT4RPL3_9ACTN|nr:acyltransferase [Solirubrobacter deserti]MBE2319944.1 acyltransferase [Solirubrobacter deserti]MDA0140462.1 acyltransferase [Solirubrobacter deserti]
MARITRPRFESFDGLRGLACVLIVVLHVWMYTDANHPRPGRTDLLDRVIGEFRVSLIFFFVLSGFLLALPWAAGKTPDLRRYAARRFARVVPGYWLAVVGSFLLLHGTEHGRAIALHDLPKFLFFIPNLFEETRNQLDPPMWSLHVEVSFYLVLPLIGYALLRRPLTTCAGLIAGGLLWTTAGVLREWPPEVTWTLPSYIGVLTCGVAAAVLAQRSPPRFVGLLGVAIVLANSWWHSDGTGTLGHAVGDLPAGIGFGLVLWSLAYRESRMLSAKPVVWLGTVSFGVYLWHYPVMYALQLHERMPERFVPAALWVFPITFALAAVSWYLVEKPAMRLGARVPARTGLRAPRRAQ